MEQAKHCFIGAHEDSRLSRAYGKAKDILIGSNVVQLIEGEEADDFAFDLVERVKAAV